jgi:hypothetical protein
MRMNRLGALLMSAALAPLSVLAADAPPAAKPEADWSDPIRQPAKWLSLGADLRLRNEYLNNAVTLNQDAPGHEFDFQRIRTRIWAEAQACKEFSVYTRLLWEGRHYTEPDNEDSWPDQDIIFDNLYARLTLPGQDVTTTVTLGRQDIIFGTGWLILEGTPLDGSRSIYFDALRAQFDFKKARTTFDLIYINQPAESDAWFHPPYYAEGKYCNPLCEENTQGAIGYLTNRSIAAANVEGYFIWKNSDAVLPNGVTGDVYTVGGALSGEIAKNLTYRAEGAGQWGTRNGDDENGFGFNGRLQYAFKDTMNNRITAGYEVLSGDDQDSNTYEGFDSLWARWPQFSELYVYTYAPETRIAQVNNLQRLWVGWDVDPVKSISFSLTYHALFALENGPSANPMFDNSGNFRGHLFTAMLKYTMNRHFNAHALVEEFLPGNFYSDDYNDNATYFRVELTFTL